VARSEKTDKMIYKITKKVDFQKDYGLRDQVRRSSVSIMANIAEGFGRHSKKEFVHFLTISSSSNIELQSHLYVALDQEYITSKTFHNIFEHSITVGKLINGFIRYLKK
jgi:four helix bundle protein